MVPLINLAKENNRPDLNPIELPSEVLNQQVRFTAAPLTTLKDLLLMSWCQISQDTFSDPEESMPWRVGAFLAACRRPTAY